MTTDTSHYSSAPAAAVPHGAISGMRPAPRGGARAVASKARSTSVSGSAATVTWLLALTPAAVIGAKAGFFVAAFIAIIQAALIVIVLMRFAWGTRIHLLVLGIGALFGVMLMAMISYDRGQYRIDVERFDTTLRGVEQPSAD